MAQDWICNCFATIACCGKSCNPAFSPSEADDKLHNYRKRCLPSQLSERGDASPRAWKRSRKSYPADNDRVRGKLSLVTPPDYADCLGMLVMCIPQKSSTAFPNHPRSEERQAKPLNYLMKMLIRRLYRY